MRRFDVHLARHTNEERMTEQEASQELPKVGPGRPKKYRKAYKKPTRKLDEFEAELQKWLKSFKWTFFGTATFDRRIKTPLSIYEHTVVMGEYSKYLPEGWEPTTWEPSLATACQMMEAVRHTLERKSWKRWKLFYVVEEHKDGTPHIHFIAGTDRSGGRDVEQLSKIWKIGSN